MAANKLDNICCLLMNIADLYSPRQLINKPTPVTEIILNLDTIGWFVPLYLMLALVFIALSTPTVKFLLEKMAMDITRWLIENVSIHDAFGMI